MLKVHNIKLSFDIWLVLYISELQTIDLDFLIFFSHFYFTFGLFFIFLFLELKVRVSDGHKSQVT